MFKKLSVLLVIMLGQTSVANAVEHYVVDTKGMHAFITFKIKHLGYSVLQGRFNRFSGDFDFDKTDPTKNKIKVEVNMKSIDSNHAERDKHLRGAKFFDVAKFPKASFVSTAWTDKGKGKAILKGKLTLRGVTKEISLDITQIGAGKDPWGGYRRGFEGTTTLHLSDYKMKNAKILGPMAENIQLWISIEGVRK